MYILYILIFIISILFYLINVNKTKHSGTKKWQRKSKICKILIWVSLKMYFNGKKWPEMKNHESKNKQILRSFKQKFYLPFQSLNDIE